MRTMKDSGVDWMGAIPENWEKPRISEILKEVTHRGKPHMPLLAASQKLGIVRQSKLPQRAMSSDENKRESFKKVEISDFVVSLRSFEGGIEYAWDDGIISPAYTVCKMNKKIAFPDYFRFVFKCHNFISGLGVFKKGIRDGQSIPFSSLRTFQAPSPPLPEQKAIAAFLDRETRKIDAQIDLLRKKSALLSEYRKAVIFEAVTKGPDRSVSMKESGVDWIGKIPDGWNACYLKKSAHLQLGKMLTPEKTIPTQVEVPYFRSANITGSSENIKKMWATPAEISKNLVLSGDILISEGGTIGFPKLVHSIDFQAIIQNSVHRVRFHQSQAYGFWVMKSIYDSGHYSTISSGVSIAHLTKEKIEIIPIPLPSLPEQEAIAAFLDLETARIDREILLIDRKTTLLAEYRKALIFEAVTGKMDLT